LIDRVIESRELRRRVAGFSAENGSETGG
jgi:hypothetical protein